MHEPVAYLTGYPRNHAVAQIATEATMTARAKPIHLSLSTLAA